MEAATAEQQLAAADLANATCNDWHDHIFDALKPKLTELRVTSVTTVQHSWQ